MTTPTPQVTVALPGFELFVARVVDVVVSGDGSSATFNLHSDEHGPVMITVFASEARP